MEISDSTRQILAVISLFLSIGAYLPYYRDILWGETKPHALSWLVWALVMVIAFCAQLSEEAGPGSWVTGLGALICVSIFILAVFQWETRVTQFDWFCLLCAIAAIPIWLLTSTPLYAVLLVTVIDLLGFLPTFRKSYHAPFEETRSTFTIAGIYWTLSLAALSNFSLVTVIYPAALAVMHFALAGFLTWCRQRT